MYTLKMNTIKATRLNGRLLGVFPTYIIGHINRQNHSTCSIIDCLAILHLSMLLLGRTVDIPTAGTTADENCRRTSKAPQYP